MAEWILAIETTNPAAHEGAAGVAVGRIDGSRAEVVDEEPVRMESRVDDDLMPAVDRIMARAGLRAADLGGVAVSVGPGGYTAIRMGVAAACMIARGAGVMVRAVPTALAAAVGASREVAPGTPMAVCLAWKGDTVWRHRFRAGSPPVAMDDGALVRIDALAGDDALVMDAVLGAKVAELRGAASAPRVALRLSAGSVIAAAAAALVAGADASRIAPIYPREPEAVTKWNAMRAQRGR